MSADQPRELKPIGVPHLEKADELTLEVFIDCWTHMFMCIAIVLEMTPKEVYNIAEASEYLKLCLGVGVTRVLKGGRRRHHRGGAGEEELVESTLAALQELDVKRRKRIADLKRMKQDAKKNALAKFQRAPSLAKRLVRLLGLVGVALLPIGSKLVEFGLKFRTAQIEHSARIAMVTAPLHAVGLAALDVTLTLANTVDLAAANAGRVVVEGASAAGNAAASAAGTANTRIQYAVGAVGREAARIQSKPGTRGAAAAAAAAAAAKEIGKLREWLEIVAQQEMLNDYYKIFNATNLPVLQQQPPGSSGTAVQKLLEDKKEEEGAEVAVPAKIQTIEVVANKLEGLRNFVSPVLAYVVLAGHLFKQHTLTYLNWSNTVAVVLFGIIVGDPSTIVLCILWVMSSLAALSFIMPFIEALTTKAEVETALTLSEHTEEAAELASLEAEEAKELASLKAAEAAANIKFAELARLAAAAPQGALTNAAAAPDQFLRAAPNSLTGGRRRATSRRYRRASGPRRTRRSSSGRRRGYSRRRRE